MPDASEITFGTVSINFLKYPWIWNKFLFHFISFIFVFYVIIYHKR